MQDELSIAAGAWLLCSGFIRAKRWELYVYLLTTLCVAESLVLLASPWEDGWFPELQLPMLGFFCACFGLLTPVFAIVFMGIGMGASLAAFIWNLWPCTDSAEIPWLHEAVIVAGSIVCCIFTACTPLGPRFVWVLVPTLGSLLLVLGTGGIWPALGSVTDAEHFVSLLDRASLFSASCAELPTTATSIALVVGVTFVVTVFQVLLARRRAEEDKKGKTNMVEQLLPSGTDAANGGIFQRPDQMTDRNSHRTIANAIFAPEGADLSYLTEDERAIVMVCRENEEQRDRVLFGGGLW